MQRHRYTVFLFLLAGSTAICLPAAKANPNHGSGATSLPGYAGIANAAPVSSPLRLDARLGYAYTRNVLTDSDSRHRGSGSLALAWSPTSYLDLAVKAHGLLDRQFGLVSGTDSSAAGLPSFLARSTTALTAHLRIGAVLEAWFPGRSAPSVTVGAASLDANALATLTVRSFEVTASLGMRFDRSSEVLDDEMIVPADLQTLSLSSSNAILSGLAASIRRSGLQYFTEIRWDKRVGTVSSASPLIVALGVRKRITNDWSLGAILQRNLVAAHASEAGQELAPHVPTTQGFIDVTYAFGTQRQATTRSFEDVAKEPIVAEETGSKASGAATTPSEPTTGTLSGRVTDDLGQPAENASVTIQIGENTYELATDAEGSYKRSVLPLLPAEITIRLAGFAPAKLSAHVKVPGTETTTSLVPLSVPAELRGQVMSKRGAILKATITLLPENVQFPNDADGTFRHELSPGEHTVQIEVPGYKTQLRTLRVRESSVSILNIEMKKTRRRGR